MGELSSACTWNTIYMVLGLSFVCFGVGTMAYLWLFKRKKRSNRPYYNEPPQLNVVYQPPLAAEAYTQPQTVYAQQQQVGYGQPQMGYGQPQMGYGQQQPHAYAGQQRAVLNPAQQQQPMVYPSKAAAQMPAPPPAPMPANPTPAPPPAPPPVLAPATNTPSPAPAAQAATANTQTITVPKGYGPGKILKLKIGEKEHKLKIPEGKTEGSTFEINLDLLPK